MERAVGATMCQLPEALACLVTLSTQIHTYIRERYSGRGQVVIVREERDCCLC